MMRPVLARGSGLRAVAGRGAGADGSLSSSAAAAVGAADPAVIEAKAGQRAWAAVCTSFLTAEMWIPQKPQHVEEDEDDNENENESEDDGEEEEGDGDDDDGFMFPGDEGDELEAATAATAAKAAAATTAPGAAAAAAPAAATSDQRAAAASSDRNPAPRPVPKFPGVGPHTARLMLADAATAVTCDGDKIKLWFHGGDGLAGLSP